MILDILTVITLVAFWVLYAIDIWRWWGKRAQDKKAMAYLQNVILNPGMLRDAAAEEKLRAQIEKRLHGMASPRSEGFSIGYTVPDPPPPPPSDTDPSIGIKEGRW